MAISSPIRLIQSNNAGIYVVNPISASKLLVNNLNSTTSSILYTQKPASPWFAVNSVRRPRPKTFRKPQLNPIAPANNPKICNAKWAPECPSSGNLHSRRFPWSPHGRNLLWDRRSPFWRSGWRIRAEDDDFEGGDDQEYEIEEDYDEDADNLKDYDVDYDVDAGDFHMVDSESFVSTDGWDAEMVVDYKINEDEFHKISLLDCDFFIRKVPDPDGDVYDFREMYVTPPDTDVYSIPQVVGRMPKKVFLMKHYKNRRADDWDFVLDLEEIYVIDSKTKSISRANVVVNVRGGQYRDRTDEVLIVRDKGTSFKIIPSDQREDPDTIIETMQWDRTKEQMENYLRGFRDYEISNWF